MSHYFIAPDAHDELTLWRVTEREPVAVFTRWQLREDPDIWRVVASIYPEREAS